MLAEVFSLLNGIWEEPQQNFFKTTIDQLSNPPYYRMPFKLHSDASGNGLGAVLYQHQDGLDRVIPYGSKSLKPAERNYPAHKLEFLALKWAIMDKFHDYLFLVPSLTYSRTIIC